MIPLPHKNIKIGINKASIKTTAERPIVFLMFMIPLETNFNESPMVPPTIGIAFPISKRNVRAETASALFEACP